MTATLNSDTAELLWMVAGNIDGKIEFRSSDGLLGHGDRHAICLELQNLGLIHVTLSNAHALTAEVTKKGHGEITRRWPNSPLALGTYSRPQDGWTPLDGDPATESTAISRGDLTLLRAVARKALVDFMSQLSENYWAAGWMHGWETTCRPDATEGFPFNGSLADEDRETLRLLNEAAEGWWPASYDDVQATRSLPTVIQEISGRCATT